MTLWDLKMMTGAVAVLILAVTVHSAPRCDLNAVLDCADIFTNISTQNGVYNIFPSIAPAQVYCDMDTDRGKWTVIQRRMDGTVNFYRPWDQYKAGFGDASGEYWLGLENIYLLTKKRKYELRVDMEDFEGNKVFARYTTFSVGPEAHGYKMTVTGFKNGGAGDSLKYSNGQVFSTFDRGVYKLCANTYHGGFWYRNCAHANLNAIYRWGVCKGYTGIFWYHWKRYFYSLKAVAMKIRPVS